MKACKKCGEIAKSNTYVAGFYCKHCGNLGFDEVFSMMDIYKEWVEYRYLCYSPQEIKERLELAKMYEDLCK